MNVQPYLLFDGRCDEMLAYYRKALSAEVQFLMRMKDNPDTQQATLPPEVAERVMHCSFRIGDTVIMGSDGNCNGMNSTGSPKFDGFQLTLSVANDAEATRAFAALSDGGKVRQPLVKTFFSPRFGMVTDRFGISWIVMVSQPNQT